MKEEKSTLPVKLTVLILFLLMIGVNFAATTGFLNNVTTAALSDEYPNLFVPAGITFSVWGIIYLLLLLYVLFQFGLFRMKTSAADEKLDARTRTAFIITSVANIGWILAWHFRIMALSVVLMLVLLVTLGYINTTLNRVARKNLLTFRERVFLRLPFSAYFGWITIATVANISAFLVSIGWDRFGATESLMMVLILGVATIIATAAIVIGRDVAYGLVVIWAFAGILMKHTLSTGFSGMYPGIILTTMVCLAILVLAIIYVLLFRRVQSPKKAEENSATEESMDE